MTGRIKKHDIQGTIIKVLKVYCLYCLAVTRGIHIRSAIVMILDMQVSQFLYLPRVIHQSVQKRLREDLIKIWDCFS